MNVARRRATLAVALATVALAGLASTRWGWLLEHQAEDAAGSRLLRAWGGWVLMVLVLVAVPTLVSGRRLSQVDMARWAALGAASIAADVLGHAVAGTVPGARTIAAAMAMAFGGAVVLSARVIAGALERRSSWRARLGDPDFVTDGALMVTMHLVGMARPACAAAFGGSMVFAHGPTRRRAGAVVLAAIGAAMTVGA